MDPILHTLIAVSLMYVCYFLGNVFGRQRGIESTLVYLLNMGVCTEEDLRKANEDFEKKD
jgi:NhaP-type Na+/H+ or K+/H+ antiporter